MSHYDEMNQRIFAAAGRGRVRVATETPEPNRAMNELLRRSGQTQREPHPAETITDDDDGFAREAKRLGVAADLVDAVRTVVPNAGELSGAALTSALSKAIDERPSLRVPGAGPPAGPAGLDGGTGRGMQIEPEETPAAVMNRAFRVATGRQAPEARMAPNGILLRD